MMVSYNSAGMLDERQQALPESGVESTRFTERKRAIRGDMRQNNREWIGLNSKRSHL